MATRKMFIEEDEKKSMMNSPTLYRWVLDGMDLVVAPVPPQGEYINIQHILRWIAEVKKR